MDARLGVPFFIFALSKSTQASASSSGLCPPGPRSWMVRLSHLRASHASPGLSGRPRGWWKSIAVSMHHGCAICSARRSDSSECPMRIVDDVMSVWRCACTSASVVVIGSRACAVMPEKLNSGLSAKDAHEL